jgi:DNA (cytosine-5)-methyltransferase 1
MVSEVEREGICEAYCGAGGMAGGFQRYFDIEHAFDIKDAAVRTYQGNHHDTSVRRLDVHNVSGCRGDFAGITGVIGGPPCQQWSRRNVHRKDNDTRGDLTGEFVRLVEEMQPRFFVMENTAWAPQEKKFRVVKTTEALGYTVTSTFMDASEYGAPQTRRRWIVIGQRGSAWRGARKRAAMTVREAFATVPHQWGLMKSREAVVANMRTATAQSWTSSSGGSGYKNMIRLRWDGPAPTVVNLKHVYMVHPEEARNISLAEGAVLQGFPPGYRWAGTESEIAQMIANAMPSQLAAAIAESVTFGGWPAPFGGFAYA